MEEEVSPVTNSTEGQSGKGLLKLIRVRLKDYAEEMEVLKKRARAEGKEKVFRKLEYDYATRSCYVRALLFRVTSAGTIEMGEKPPQYGCLIIGKPFGIMNLFSLCLGSRNL